MLNSLTALRGLSAVVGGPSGTPAWDPSQIPNLAAFFWYKASTVIPASLGHFTQATGQFGTARNATSAGALAPLLDGTGASVQDNGGLDFMTFTPLSLTGDFVAWVVMEVVQGVAVPFGNTSEVTFGTLGFDANGIQFADDTAGFAPSDPFKVSIPFGNPVTVCVRKNGNVIDLQSSFCSQTIDATLCGTITLDSLFNTGQVVGYPSGSASQRHRIAAISTSYYAKGSSTDLSMRAWLDAQGYPPLLSLASVTAPDYSTLKLTWDASIPATGIDRDGAKGINLEFWNGFSWANYMGSINSTSSDVTDSADRWITMTLTLPLVPNTEYRIGAAEAAFRYPSPSPTTSLPAILTYEFTVS